MIDHLGVPVTDYEKSKAFYLKALAPINYSLLLEFPAAVTGTTDVAGFGENGKPDYWISKEAEIKGHIHVAFRVPNRALVDAFYEAAMAAGGTDNGAPGVRAIYHPNYYGAFVRDPDGHNIEAVCHEAP
jgi:catechol 2,3-dioxygenase-like lactoylglutathione lyase family enzyme